jgi:dolichyl-phosphate-mannose--protein O-mannosyl transferase
MITDRLSVLERSTLKSRKSLFFSLKYIYLYLFIFRAYGDKFIVDNNDVWILNILTDDGQILQDKSVIFQPLVHNFRLIHSRGCALVSIEAYLPENKQQEVACMNSAAKHVYSWTVETAMHQKGNPTHKTYFFKFK